MPAVDVRSGRDRSVAAFLLGKQPGAEREAPTWMEGTVLAYED